MRHLAVAFGFLTRIPVPDVSGDGATPVTDEDLRFATTWFPLVGLVIGGLGAAARWGLDAALGATAASVVAVAVTGMATGAFHEDGWADTFDGLWGGWTPERRIEIMRDSRVGTYGALALLLAVLLQVTLLAGMEAGPAALALMAAHVLGRWTILVQIRYGQPAQDQGHGAKVADPLPTRRFVAVTVVALAVAKALLDPSHPQAVAGAVLAALLTTWLFGAIARNKIAGATGDVLGATAMAGILATLTAATAVANLA